MRPDDWQLTEDIDGFLARAGNFMCSRPALHNTPLTDIEKLRTRGADAHGNEVTVFGRLESGGDIRAIFYRTPAVVRPSHPSLPPQTGMRAPRPGGRNGPPQVATITAGAPSQ
ncbi:hypothetical protein [Streptomyces asiaticus]|uniref:hypothetical protein n=1 Tax=Streptomyces asiaticus TaxID=114695 RepID=UPI003801DF38